MSYERPITVANARTLLWRYVTTDPADGDGTFLFMLNQAIERMIGEGIWSGTKEVVDLESYVTDNVLTLPYEYDNLMAVQIDGNPTPIFTELAEFMESGPGNQTAGQGGNRIIDMGFVMDANDQLVREYKCLMEIGATTTVRGMCRKRFVYLTEDTELVHPANIGALKNALLAMHFESEADLERSRMYWQNCVQILSQDASLTKIGVQQPVAMRPYGLPGKSAKPMSLM